MQNKNKSEIAQVTHRNKRMCVRLLGGGWETRHQAPGGAVEMSCEIELWMHGPLGGGEGGGGGGGVKALKP